MVPASTHDNAVTERLRDSMVQASFTIVAHLSRTAAENDLSLTQLRLLGILRDREPNMAQLAGFLGLERSSVSGLIDRAVARGLATRASSLDDGRAVRVSLTEEGFRLAGLIGIRVGDYVAHMAGHLSAAEQGTLSTLLNKMLE
jgi:DNA-binding MarR family transcriptional regulator